MPKENGSVTITAVEKPACKLIIKRGISSTDYFGFCEEIGCEVFDLLADLPHGLEEKAFVELPPKMRLPDTAGAAAAREVSQDFTEEIPADFEILMLPAHLYLQFQTAPYRDESMFGAAHDALYQAIAAYEPERHGYLYAKDSAPVFHYFASAANGVKQMIPVQPLSTI